MTETRSDICYFVTLLSQPKSKSTKVHLNRAKSVLRCIKGTLNCSLRFTKFAVDVELCGFSDLHCKE